MRRVEDPDTGEVVSESFLRPECLPLRRGTLLNSLGTSAMAYTGLEGWG